LIDPEKSLQFLVKSKQNHNKVSESVYYCVNETENNDRDGP
jgi:hypothetical protein